MRMRARKAGPVYFVLVFGAGFILGPIRVLWLTPRLGGQVAELMEAPLMLAVTIAAARWAVLRLAVPPAPQFHQHDWRWGSRHWPCC